MSDRPACNSWIECGPGVRAVCGLKPSHDGPHAASDPRDVSVSYSWGPAHSLPPKQSEVERLRGENESLRLDRDSWRHKNKTDNLYLLGENEKLKEALMGQWMAAHFDHCSRYPEECDGRGDCVWPLPAALKDSEER